MRHPLSGRGALLGSFTSGTTAAVLGLGGPIRRSGDRDVTNWQHRVIESGGSLSSSQLEAVKQFVRTLKDTGQWDNIHRINPFVGEQLTAAMTPIKVGLGFPTEANSNFVPADFTPSIGITGNAGNKQLDTGLQIMSLDKSNFGMGTWISRPWGTAARMSLIGSSYLPTGNTNRFYNHTIGLAVADIAMGGSFGGVGIGTGLVSQETTGIDVTTAWLNGTLQRKVTTWNNDGFQPGTIVLFANGNAFFSSHSLGGYYIGKNLNQTVLAQAWNALNVRLGR